jgi:tetratricopeptide (TPR) repeat protein
VSALLGGSASIAGDWLRALADREVVAKSDEGGGRFPGDEEFSFRHALTGEAVYATLTDEDLRHGHLLAAEWLEKKGERDAVSLAEHFERGGDPERAAHWYARAAAEADEGNDIDGTLAMAKRAMTLAPSLNGSMHYLSARACSSAGQLETSEHHCMEAMRLCRRGSAEWFHAGTLMVAMAAFGRYARLGEVVEALRREEGGDDVASPHLEAWSMAANMLFVSGQSDAGLELVQRIEERAPRAMAIDPYSEKSLHHARYCRTMYVTGEPEQVYLACKGEVDIMTRANDWQRLVWSLIELASAQSLLGAFEDASHTLEDLLPRVDATPFVLAYARHRLAFARMRLHRPDDAIALQRQANDVFVGQNIPLFAGLGLNHMAQFVAQAGDLAQALPLAAEAVDQLFFAPPMRVYALATLSDVRRRAGQLTEALGAAREAEQLSEAIGVINEGESPFRLALVEALLAIGEPEAARAALAVARDRLLARAGTIGDAATRKRYLERVAENARTLALARELLPA